MVPPARGQRTQEGAPKVAPRAGWLVVRSTAAARGSGGTTDGSGSGSRVSRAVRGCSRSPMEGSGLVHLVRQWPHAAGKHVKQVEGGDTAAHIRAAGVCHNRVQEGQESLDRDAHVARRQRFTASVSGHAWARDRRR